jgi:hypothetical protein
MEVRPMSGLMDSDRAALHSRCLELLDLIDAEMVAEAARKEAHKDTLGGYRSELKHVRRILAGKAAHQPALPLPPPREPGEEG